MSKGTLGYGKTTEALHAMRTQEIARHMLDRDFKAIFENVEANMNPPPDPTWLRINKSDARMAAVDAVVSQLDADDKNPRDIKLEGKWSGDDKLAIEIAEQYRHFLEHPEALTAHVATRVRG